MPYDEELARCIRNALSDEGDVREQHMMGALCFMVDGHMCCGVTGNALMVRVGRDAWQAALNEENVRPMELSGRMPRGFILVDLVGTGADDALMEGIARGRNFIATLPSKPEGN